MTMTINAGGLLAAFIAAMGIPSAIMGLIAWRIKTKIEARESARDVAAAEKGKAQQELVLILVQGTRASIALGEATARAVQRIPDAHCNGDMHAALDYAVKIKHEQKDFLAKQGIHALIDE